MSASMTIALVSTTWGKDASGGATFEEDVLRAALEMRTPHRLIVYPDTTFTRAIVAAADASSRVTFVKPMRKPRLPKRVLRRVGRVFRRRRPPLLPFAELSEALLKAGAQCAWMLGGSIIPLDMPYVATIWDLQHRLQPWFPETSSNGEWRERERLYSEFVRRAAAVVAGTSSGADEIRDAYGSPPGGVHVLPLPTPSFALSAKYGSSLRPDDVPSRYLLYPAQFWAHKNHVTAVRALSAMTLFDHPPDLVCVGADRGTKEHVMRLASRMGVAERVHLLGFVDRDTLVGLYRNAEALLYPSLFGPDNLPPLEAMALGCPVIAARVSGAEEQLGDAALLVDPLDATGYAAAVRTLRHDPIRRDTLIARGRARAEGWTAAQYASAVFALIDAQIAPMRALWP